MGVFTIFKILGQVFGVFPFRQGKIFYVSKLYLVVNVFVGFLLVTFASLVTNNTLHTSLDSIKSTQINKHPLLSVTLMLLTITRFGQLAASLTAVITKFIWRKEYVENLNAILEFLREHRVDSILNTTTKSDYFFIVMLCVSIMVETNSFVFDVINSLHSDYMMYSFIIRLQINLDEIIFCIVCSALSKYQCAIKQMILSHVIYEKREEITSHNTNAAKKTAGDCFHSQLQQINVLRIPEDRNYSGRTSASTRAQKLECFRKMNLKFFNIYSNHSALYQYQLFISTMVLTVSMINIIFSALANFWASVRHGSGYQTVQALMLFGLLISNLIRIFAICHFSDKAFNDGMAIKNIIQEINRNASSEKDLTKVSKIFMEQVHMRKQCNICGIFAFNMTLPVTFMEYAMEYVVVLVQYLGLRI